MNALLAFEASVRCGSFAAAARELNVTPAAVSRMVARLEAHLGTLLLRRGPAGGTPTESGALLFGELARSFRGLEAALTEISARRAGARSVTLSVSTAFTTHWLMPRMGRFQADLPEVDLHFRLLPGPSRGPVDEVDLGMRFDPFDRDHEVTALAPEIVLAVCSPAYLGTWEPSAPSGPPLREAAIIGLSGGETDWLALLDEAGAAGRPAPSLTFTDYAVVVQAALLGQGIAPGWLNVVGHWLGEGALVPAVPRIRRTGRTCQLVRARSRAASRAVAAVRDWIEAEMGREIALLDARHPGLGLCEPPGAGASDEAPIGGK